MRGLCLLVAVVGWARAVDEVSFGSRGGSHEPRPGEQKISFKPPQLDEEESDSLAVPAQYKCDVCAAIAYQIEGQLRKAEGNKSAKRLRRLSEIEVMDVLETQVCTKDNMGEYGIKGIADAEPGQEKLLNGPGLPRSMGKMGVIQGGGQWPNRLGRRCKEIIGDVGEDVIYDMYVQSSENAQLQAPENPEEEHALMFSRLCVEDAHEGSTGDCGGGQNKKKKDSKGKDGEKEGGKKKKKKATKKKKAKSSKGEL